MTRDFLLLAAYLLGSLSFSVILVRVIARKDIRTEGSGNAGATNVLRAHGWKPALMVALLDVGKGALAVGLMALATADPWYRAGAGFLAVVGHVFPVFFGFRGGKGVATTVGAFLALAPAATLVVVGVFVLLVALTRIVSIGSVVSSVLLPPVARLFFHAPTAIVAAASATAILILYKHIPNLKRLARGEERRLGRKK
jgi:acyl phosphate:glycerol-3-phosphate acyltransferase